MGININIKKQYKVNGKTYNSLEELPEDIRQALTSGASGITFSRHFNAEAKITFNGREYDTPDAMDPDVRERYEKIMRAAAGGQTQELAEAVQEDQVKPQEIIPTVPYTTPQIINPVSAFPAWLIPAMIVLAAMVYFFWFHGK